MSAREPLARKVIYRGRDVPALVRVVGDKASPPDAGAVPVEVGLAKVGTELAPWRVVARVVARDGRHLVLTPNRARRLVLELESAIREAESRGRSE